MNIFPHQSNQRRLYFTIYKCCCEQVQTCCLFSQRSAEQNFTKVPTIQNKIQTFKA
ncbi:hypothetical protein C0J52_26491 [Blattella germanica]|nr:hypothetical protein C0J52_26491 [Blattella germanica]